MKEENYETIFNVNDLNIKLKSNNKNIIKDLISLYGDYFAKGTYEDFTINYYVTDKNKKGIPYKEKNQTEYNYIERIGNEINIYMPKYTDEDTDFIKRMYTTTLIKLLQLNGYTIIHGACVYKDDKAIIISGDKRAGKTTTMLNLLKRGYNYIANDRIAIKKEGEDIVVVGIPFSMGIIMKDIAGKIDKTKLKVDIDGDEAKIYLENNMIKEAFNVDTKNISYVKAIIIPSRNETDTNFITSKIYNPVHALGSNIMTDDAIPKEKGFLNKMFPVKYGNNEFINDIPIYSVRQTLSTFDKLNSFISESIIAEDKKDVLRLTRSFK